MMAIEAEFDSNIPDEAAGKIVTVEDAVKYIQENAKS
jgi:acyl carrier protein